METIIHVWELTRPFTRSRVQHRRVRRRLLIRYTRCTCSIICKPCLCALLRSPNASPSSNCWHGYFRQQRALTARMPFPLFSGGATRLVPLDEFAAQPLCRPADCSGVDVNSAKKLAVCHWSQTAPMIFVIYDCPEHRRTA